MVRAQLDKVPADVARMFDGVARRYDLTNTAMTGGLDRHWRKAVDGRPGQRLLDLAAGTAVSTAPFADAGLETVACDFSLGMLKVGRRRRPDLDLIAGDATALPFADASFDAVTICFGLRNVVDHEKGLAEMLRVTRPGGRLVVCEFSRPVIAPIRLAYHGVVLKALPRIAERVSSNPEAYVYLSESIAAWPDQTRLAEQIRDAGWERVGCRNLATGIVALHTATRSLR